MNRPTKAVAIELIKKIQDRRRALCDKKNKGYAGVEGEENFFSNFEKTANDAKISVEQGLFVRLSDKYHRLVSLMENSSNDEVQESFEDTLSDLSNYSDILMLWKFISKEEKTEKEEIEPPFQEKKEPEGANLLFSKIRNLVSNQRIPFSY